MNEINSKVDYPYNLIEAVCGSEDVCIASDVCGSVEYALFTLTERERDILHLYFREGKTFTEIGKIYDITRERIRQIQAKALRKLRIPSRSKYIEFGVQGVIEQIMEKYAERISELTEKMLYLTSITDSNMNKVIEKCEAVRQHQVDQLHRFNLSVRSYNCLSRAGLNTLSEVASLSFNQFLSIRNLGRKSREEIIHVLEQNGYNVNHLKGGEE